MVQSDVEPTDTSLSASGARFAAYIARFAIADFWIAGHPVIWQTGQASGPPSGDPAHSTHCSAFVAAVALGLDVYILRPKNHPQKLLANAQVDWLSGATSYPGPTAAAEGWRIIGTGADPGAFEAAVAAASAGSLVVAGFQNPDSSVSGHIVVVLPVGDPSFGSDGPAVISVGGINRPSTSMREAFHAHRNAFPDAIHLFARDTDLQIAFDGA